MLAKYTAALPPAPVSVDWSGGIKAWGVMRNDMLGDCTCAAVGHAIQTWTKNAGVEKTIPDSAVVGLYSAVSGYTPANPASDQGAVETDVLTYWLKHRVDGHPLDGFVALQPKDIRDVKDAIWLFGGVYTGLALPVSAQAQDVWVVPPQGLVGDGAAGSWGGHAVYVVAYDSRGLTCITWGALEAHELEFLGCLLRRGLWAPVDGLDRKGRSSTVGLRRGSSRSRHGRAAPGCVTKLA